MKYKYLKFRQIHFLLGPMHFAIKQAHKNKIGGEIMRKRKKGIKEKTKKDNKSEKGQGRTRKNEKGRGQTRMKEKEREIIVWSGLGKTR